MASTIGSGLTSPASSASPAPSTSSRAHEGTGSSRMAEKVSFMKRRLMGEGSEAILKDILREHIEHEQQELNEKIAEVFSASMEEQEKLGETLEDLSDETMHMDFALAAHSEVHHLKVSAVDLREVNIKLTEKQKKNKQQLQEQKTQKMRSLRTLQQLSAATRKAKSTFPFQDFVNEAGGRFCVYISTRTTK